MTWWPWRHRRLIGIPHGPNPGMLYRKNALFYRPAAQLRPMTVMVDAGLRAHAKDDERVKYLLELLAVQPIQAHFYGDEGPPLHSQPVIAAATGVEGVKDWVVMRQHEDGEGVDVVYLKDNIPTRVPTQVIDPVFRALSQTLPQDHEPSANLAAQVRADALAMVIAKAIRADLLITNRHLLVDTGNDFWRTTTVLRPEDALPLVGLYLRQQGKFVLARTPALGGPSSPSHTNERDRMWFYWQAAEGLLPAVWRWETAWRSHVGTTGDGILASLPKALTWRLDQMLRSRDDLLATLAVAPQDYGPAEEALTELDQILLWLMAAFDITAQVAHVALGIQMKLRNAAWQFEEWLKKVAHQDQALADLVRNGNDGEHVLTIVRDLRNSVHGEALSAGGMIPVVGDHALQTLVRLPKIKQQDVLKAMEALGGAELWGVAQPLPDRDLHLHPGVFVERLLPHALSLLNALIAATPVERLQGLAPHRLPGPHPRSLADHRVLWQLGL